jgi:glycosyltransferase involved in cell wall biosynthesis
MISILILTKNEEYDIGGCIESVKWSDDIHVYDSYSTDKTIEIAKGKGAFISRRAFDDYANQRNAAISEVDYKYPWLFILDADERCTPALSEEMLQKVKEASNETSAFSIDLIYYFLDSKLTHAQTANSFIRLIKPAKCIYDRGINERLMVDGIVDKLENSFNHYPFSKGLKHWIDKHNHYSKMEAERWIEENRRVFNFSMKKAIFAKTFYERRYHQKGIFYKLPARPIIKWLYMVVWRRAFLDGRAGITYATLQAIYEYLIVLKTRELLSQRGSSN